MADVALPSPPEALPRPSPPLLLTLRALLLLTGAYLLLGFPAQAAHIAFGLWFTQLFVFLWLAGCLVRRSGRDPIAYPGLRWVGSGPVLTGFLLGAANFFAVLAPIQYVSSLLFPEAMQDTVDRLIFERQSPVQLALVVGAVSVAAPLCEEYFFRGIVQQGFRRAGSSALRSVLVTALIFSTYHMDETKFVPLLEAGALFGLLRMRTGSLWPAIAAHAGNNVVTATIFLATRGETEPAAHVLPEPAAIATVAGAGGLLLVAILWAVRRVPALLPAHPLEPEPPALPPAPAGRLYGTWLSAMALAVALLLAVDRREVQLNFHDLSHPLPRVPADAPRAEHRLREGLEALRARAERGEIPLEEYFDARRQLGAGRGLELPAVPPSETAPTPGG